jgi:hypothetical protein
MTALAIVEDFEVREERGAGGHLGWEGLAGQEFAF